MDGGRRRRGGEREEEGEMGRGKKGDRKGEGEAQL